MSGARFFLGLVVDGREVDRPEYRRMEVRLVVALSATGRLMVTNEDAIVWPPAETDWGLVAEARVFADPTGSAACLFHVKPNALHIDAGESFRIGARALGIDLGTLR